MHIKPSKQDTIWSFLGTALNIGSNLIILPFVLTSLTDDATGIYYVFSTISGITILFDFGFAPSIARSMAYAWSGAEKLRQNGVTKSSNEGVNIKLLQIIICVCKRVYLIIGLLALFLLMVIGTPYVTYIIRDNPLNEYYIAWIIYIFAIFFNLFYGYYLVFLRGIGAVAGVNKITIISRVSQIILCITLLKTGFGLVGISIGYLSYGLLFRVLANFTFYKYENIGQKIKNNYYHPRKEDIKEVFNAVWPNTWRDGIVAVSNYILNQSTTIIASLYLSLHMTGIYSLCCQLTAAIAQISGTFYTSYQPALQSAYANRDTDKQKKYLSIIIVTFIIIFFVGMIGLCTVGIPLIKLIKPSYEIDILILLGVGIYQFMLKIRNCYCTYISSTNRVIYLKAFLVSAIICVSLSVIFAGVFKMEAWGLILAQIVSQLVYNIWKWPYVVHKELKFGFCELVRVGLEELITLLHLKKSKAENKERKGKNSGQVY